MSQSEKCDVIIIGAGIAGLTAALCLAKNGLSVTIFERSQKLEEAGAGVQLTPNASRVLCDLGLEEELVRVSAIPQALHIGTLSNTAQLSQLDLQALAAQYGAPWLALRRADLQKILLKAVLQEPDITLKLGRTIELFTQTDTGVIVKCRAPNDSLLEYQASLLVGADGIWSGVRPYISSPMQPYFTGFEAWRALLPADLVPEFYKNNTVRLQLGHGCHLVTYPISPSNTLNIVLIRRANEQRDVAGKKSWSHSASATELSSVLQQASPEMVKLFSMVKSWQVWSLYDMPVAQMAAGHVALIGDAAHPILPFLAQGAALAIEDAAIMAKCLDVQHGNMANFPQALLKFVALRQKRAKKVASAACNNGRIYHLGWPLSLARDKTIKFLGAKGMAHKYKWLYGWKP
jgi:salicylate hydroxylase